MKNRRKSDLKYMNNETNFVRASINRIFKPSSMYPKVRKGYNYIRKGWIPEMTKPEVFEEWEQHKTKFGKLCRYCDIELTFIRTGTQKRVPTNFSVDRFNTDITYKKGNVMFCCSRCNSLKNGSTLSLWKRLIEIEIERQMKNELEEK